MSIDKLIKKKQHAKREGNLCQLAEISKTLGDTYFENQQSEEALREYTEQLSICEGLQDKLNSAIAHRMIGEVYASLGDYEEALMHQNLHLEGAREIRNLIEEQRAFATLGRTYFCLAESLSSQSHKYNEALANAKMAYVKSMELCDQLTGTEIKLEEKLLMRARLLLNLGLTLEAQKETGQAIDLIEQATELCVSKNFQEDLHRACISLAGIYERQGNQELALSYIETAGTVNDTRLKAEAMMSKTELLMRTGQWIKARKVLISLYTSSGLPKDIDRWVEKYLRIMVTLCRAENNLLLESDIRAKEKLYETLGDASVAAQCFEKGVEYYRQMLACAEKTGSEIGVSLVSLAQTLKDAGRYEEALPYARRELELCTDPRETCRSALFLADLSIETNARETEIREYYALASSSANESDNNAAIKLQKSVTKEFAGYLESIGQFDEARDVKRKAEMSLEAPSDTESEASSDGSDKIGADVCLEDLSDLEKDEETVKVTKRRRKRASTIKRNEKGETQLHVACINGDINAVERLLSSGHSTNVRDHCGWSPLHEAANHGYVDIAELLLKHGANINDPGGASCKGMTPLHDAACCGHFSMMQLLTQHGASLTLKTHDGDTVLDCLEEWRDRVNDLSPEDLVEYDVMHKKLSAVIPTRNRKRKKCDIVETSDERSELRQVSAGEDYKRTIANLRCFNKANKAAAALKSSDESRAPLVNEQRILANDDWLEDDVGSMTRKRKASNGHTEKNVTTLKRKSADGNVESEKATKKLKVQTKEEASDASEGSDDNSASEILEIFKEVKRKRQTCLISSGFTVSRSPSPVINSQSSPRYSDISTNSKEYVRLRTRVKEMVLDLKVEVCEDEQEFLTRVTTAAECTFYHETGCTAKLLLQPINGCTMASILQIARENTSDKLECEMVELQIPSTVERYKTICHTYDTAPREITLKCLKSCENTRIFRVKPDDTDKELLVPLLRTLAYERNVRVLQLSGMALLTAGTCLHRCLSNLSLLQELCLKGCDIDFACLREIDSLPTQLRVLDLSYNPLSPKSCDTLRKLIAPLRYLQTLDLRYCELDDLCLPLDNPNLTSCDISWNRLNRHATTWFLSRQLFDLNLSNVLSCDQSVSSLDVTSTVLSPSLESLELSFCDVTDTDVKIILAQLPRLLKLILRGNTKVSPSSVNALLARQPTLTYIDVSGCKSIASSPDAGLVIQNPEMCTLLASMVADLCDAWIKLWRDTATVTRLPHNLAIFRPT
ncbi:Tonsoku-like protein [Ooceraea biroi]|uniref:Tonsoku-like protein n=1 Tax=Ooceraea biroi TaxID=2015173 RepID=A0A026WTZ3_OOCBI|nr:Tonsoku-like protein [Ooceraea biroi]